MKLLIISTAVLLLAVTVSSGGDTGRRPDPEKTSPAAFSRWLIKESSWGVLSTIDSDTDSRSPFSNIHCFTDNGTGVPYFYQSRTLERTGRNAVRDPWASFAVTEYALGYCDGIEVQSPVCAKLTLSGKLLLLKKNTSEAMSAEAVLLAEFPGFRRFPKMMMFDVFKLIIEDIFLVNKAAPPANISVAEYFSVQL